MRTSEIINWTMALFIIIGINMFLFSQNISFTGWATGQELTLELVSPANNSELNASNVTVNLTTNNPANCSLNGTQMVTTGDIEHSQDMSNLENGNYEYIAECNDSINTTSITFNFVINVTEIIEENQTINETVNETINETANETSNETANIICDINLTSPLINITNKNFTTLKATSACNCNYTLNDANNSFENLTNTTYNSNINLAEGNNNITITCGNETKTITIFADTTAPSINKTSPINSTIKTNSTWINATTSETANCYLNNTLMSKTENNHYRLLSNLINEKTYNYILSCKDLLNNSNNITVTFTTDYGICGDKICQSNENVSCYQDCDADRDGILDSQDKLLGSKGDVELENVKYFSIEVDDSDNIGKNFTGNKTVRFLTEMMFCLNSHSTSAKVY